MRFLPLALAAFGCVGTAAGASIVELSHPRVFTAREGATAPVAIRRSGDLTVPSTVRLVSSNRTAVAGTDFPAVDVRVNFAPGEAWKEVPVPTFNNGLVEERFREADLFLLEPAPDGTVIGNVTAVLSIEDDETPTVADPDFRGLPGAGPDNDVFALALQPDGKLIVGGQFTNIGGFPRPRLARLLSNGALDETFPAGGGPNGDVYAIALQPDGKIFVAGAFTAVGAANARYVARLHADGSVDTSFNPGAGPNNELRALALQPDGSVLIGGRFTSVAGQSRGRVARLDTTGSLDATFGSGLAGASGNVRTLALQPDGRVLIGGDFTSVNGSNRVRLARLNTDGSLDTAFDPGAGASAQVRSLAVLADGRVLAGGEFFVFNGTNRAYLARLWPNGSLDLSFNAGWLDGPVRAVAVDGSGDVWIGGGFREIHPFQRRYVARLRPGGAVHPDFNPRDAFNDEVFALLLSPDGRVFLGGQFTPSPGMPWGRVARVFADSRTNALEFAEVSFAATESSLGVSAVVRRTGQSSNALSVAYSMADESAEAGPDYTSAAGVLEFPPLAVSRELIVPLANDGLAEALESFAVALADPIGPARLGRHDAARVLIVDGDGGQRLVMSSYRPDERHLDTGVNLYREGDTNAPLTLRWETLPGTATPGMDYVARTQTVTIGRGERNNFIIVPLLNDSLQEGEETFHVAMRHAGTGELLATNTFTIVDNEIGLVMEPPLKSVEETAGAVWMVVRCLWDLTVPATVQYATRDQGATVGVDYSARMGTLTFTTDGDAGVINVPILNDGLVEGPESFEIVLSGVTGQPVVIHPRGLVTILDNDAGLEFTSAEYVAGEGQGTVRLAVRRNDDGTEPLTVEFATRPGTATPGEDYTPATGTLMLAPGETNRAFFVPVLDDSRLGIEETFTVFLRQPGPGAALGEVTSAVVRLLDNDRPGSLLSPIGSTNLPLIPASSDVKIAVQPDGRVVAGMRGLLLRLTADGERDPTFAASPRALGFAQYVPALQPDGRILVGSAATNHGFSGDAPLHRVLSDGASDPAFQAGVLFGATRAVAVQPDGRILMAGSYEDERFAPTRTNNGVVRLLPDGSVDPGFRAGTFLPRSHYFAVPATVEAMLLEPDGRVVVGGLFTNAAGVPSDRIARLNADGTRDPSFLLHPGVAGNATVFALARQTDGKLLVGGSFTNLQGAARNHLTRLNTDGTVDISFTPPLALGQVVRAIAVLDDGRILVGGGLAWDPGYLLRLHSDGRPDATFDIGEPPDGPVTDLAVRPNGEVIVAGNFRAFAGVGCSGVVWINGGNTPYSRIEITPRDVTVTEGNRVLQFTVTRTGETDGTTEVDFQTTGLTAVSGEDFIAVNGTLTFAPGEATKLIDVPLLDDARFESDETLQLVLSERAGSTAALLDPPATVTILDNERPGSVDERFTGMTDQNSVVHALAVQPDGKVLLGGSFGLVSGTPARALARLNADGSLDNRFHQGIGGYSYVYELALLPDGRILLAGDFDGIRGWQSPVIARLLSDGSPDPAFRSPVISDPPFSRTASALAVLPDGRLLIAGNVVAYPGDSVVARLLPDGGFDASFTPAAVWAALTLVPQADGRVVVGGSYSQVNGSPRPSLARLNADGSLDEAFPAGFGPDGPVHGALELPDGRLIVVGGFTTFDGVARGGIARLLPNGALDVSTAPGVGADGTVLAVIRQPDGRLLIGGYFSAVNGVPRQRVARLHADLSLDLNFDPGLGPRHHYGESVHALAWQPDAVLIGGNFTSVSSLPVGGVARLRAGFRSALAVPQSRAGGGVDVMVFTQPGGTYAFEQSGNLAEWTRLETRTASGDTLTFIDARASVGSIFYRAVELAR